jgi:hypothetical protein
MALALSACGSSEPASRPALKLSREDLIAVCSALERVTAPAGAEVAAAKHAWPSVADGLPRAVTPAARSAIEAAAASAAAIPTPSPLTRAQAPSLTGPASEIAGLFDSYLLLASRGWQLIAATTEKIQRGSSTAARFARENVPLYIESVYDGHFSLAQIGKKLRDGYRALGGASAFGTALTPARVSALAGTYSEARDRLHPHVGVRLGS